MKCITDKPNHQRGFTLVELMVALVLGLIVVGGSLALFLSQRVTSSLSGQMAEVQAEGRIAMDAMARDLRAAGDFGCWPVSNPIEGRLKESVFSVSDGGVLGYDSKAALDATASGTGAKPYRIGTVSSAAPAADASILVLTGISGTLTALNADMSAGTDALVVKTVSENFAANDIAVVTDCINWAKFQVSEATEDEAGSTTLTHLAATPAQASVWGKGNIDGNIGAVFRKDSSVGRLDSVWWYLKADGLYRMSGRDNSPVLVSKRVYGLTITYDVDTNSDGVIDSRNQTATQVASNWPKVRAASIQMLMRSEKPANGGGVAPVSSFAGKTIPENSSDKHLYLPLQMTVALRNQ